EHDAGAMLRAQHCLGGKPDVLLAVCPFDGADLAEALGHREPFAQVIVGDIAGEIALPDHGIIDPSLIPRERRGIIERSRARVAGAPKGPRDCRKPAPRCRTSTAGLPTNPENNYHSAVQPENTGRMVNRL